MVSSRHEFHNNLRILHGIDRHEVAWMDDAQWAAFRDNPVRFFLKCDDEQLDLIWSVIVSRQPHEAPMLLGDDFISKQLKDIYSAIDAVSQDDVPSVPSWLLAKLKKNPFHWFFRLSPLQEREVADALVSRLAERSSLHSLRAFE